MVGKGVIKAGHQLHGLKLWDRGILQEAEQFTVPAVAQLVRLNLGHDLLTEGAVGEQDRHQVILRAGSRWTPRRCGTRCR